MSVTQTPVTASTLPAHLLDLIGADVATAAAISRTALRYEYVGCEPILAHMASGGALDHAAIDALGRAIDSGQVLAGPDLERLDPPAVYALAFLTMGRATSDDDVSRAADLFALAREVARHHGARTEHPDLDLQTSLVAGRHDYVRRNLDDSGVDPWVRWALSADLVNPYAGPDAPLDDTAWLTLFNRRFAAAGIAPIRVADPLRPFDSVVVVEESPRARTVDGPSVTIVVSVFKPSQSLVTAVGGLVDQTWKNLQILIVDDCSPEEYAPIFDAVRALDSRVDYIRMPVNGGAYLARNHGITQATGEFVGFQDADDWSHPERLERQMSVMTGDLSIVATLSKAVRLHADLRISKPGTFPFEKNAPSLIFRRREVLARLGPFDRMRKAADTEFIERLAAVYGTDAVVTLDEPLSLYQLTDGSLSRSDFRMAWHRESRVSYHSSFRYWHRRIVEDGVDPVIESGAGRAFAAPPGIEGVDHSSTPLDVVVLADWRSGLVERTGLPAELRALSSAGLTVGLARGEALRHAKVTRFYAAQTVVRVVAEGRASWTPLGADLTPRVLLVRDPDLLALDRAPDTIRMRPHRVVVVADRVPTPAGPRRLSYDPAVVEAVALRAFGRAVEWLPASNVVEAALTAAGAAGALLPPHGLEVVEVGRHAQRLVSGRPVIGTSDASRFTAERADRSRLNRILPHASTYDVRVLEATGHLRHRADDTWLGFDTSMLTLDEFLDQCDFYVGLAPQVSGTSLHRPILDAMARGCVPIVDPCHEPLLGDSALYFGDRDFGDRNLSEGGDRPIATIVDEVWADPARFRAQQERSIAFCQTELSAAALAGAVTSLTAMERPL